MYYALIGDIKKSKNISDAERYKVQDRLAGILNQINTRYSNDIAAKFLVTLGDEFQGLLENPEHILDILKFIQNEMYPLQLRIGIGIGEINTKINPEMALGADGPAFYAARKLIDELRAEEKKYKKQAADVQIGIYNQTNIDIDVINTMLHLLKTIEDDWTNAQRISIWQMLKEPSTQKECAMKLQTTQSTIAKRLRDGNYNIYKNALETIKRTIIDLQTNKLKLQENNV